MDNTSLEEWMDYRENKLKMRIIHEEIRADGSQIRVVRDVSDEDIRNAIDLHYSIKPALPSRRR